MINSLRKKFIVFGSLVLVGVLVLLLLFSAIFQRGNSGEMEPEPDAYSGR